MLEKKKILYIITQSEWGGAQKYVYDLAVALSSRGIPPRRDNEGSLSVLNRIATPSPLLGKGWARNDIFFEVVVAAGEDKNGELFERLAQKEIRTIYLKNLIRKISPWTDFLCLLEIIKLIKTEKPDIIHLNSSKISILGSLVAFLYKFKIKNLKFKIIYTVHGWVFNEPLPAWQKKFYFWAEKITALFKHKLICVSEYDRQIALRYKITKEQKLITIHNGVDVNVLKFLERNEAREKLLNIIDSKFIIQSANWRKESRIIGAIANFYPTKGLDYLVEAADLVKKKFPEVFFVLIGDGQQKNWLQKRISQLNLGNNFKLLKIPDAYQYLKAFDVFVLSSVKEGLPYTILEAMAAELPIVATCVGGIPEMIEDGISGFLVEPRDSENLAKKISRLLENPELAKKLAKNAKEKFDKKFGFEKMIDKTIQIYNK